MAAESMQNWSQEEKREKTKSKTTGDGSKVEKMVAELIPHESQYENKF
jgi:N6-adenosine-specific RNA methylase IME4